MPFAIILSEKALADLDGVATAGDDDREGELKARGILRQFARLEHAPRAGSTLEGQGDRDLRQLEHVDYVIVFEVSDRDRTVTVHRVWPLACGQPQF